MKILFVVHRTYPYNGGSEYNIKLISEGLSNVGYDVSVLTDASIGSYGNVKVINDRNVLFSNDYDWIIIHGNDMPIQDYALNNIQQIKSKVLYWIIKPSNSLSAINGFKYANIIGWGTSYDYSHVVKHNCLNKSRYIRYACDIEDSIGIKTKSTIRYFFSSGGFAQHKGFNELVQTFLELNLTDTKLILSGYIGEKPDVNHNNIIIHKLDNRKDYLNMLTNSTLYIMNSFDEGFGLVLLDAMINKVPWISRNIAGATDMSTYGNTYLDKNELKSLMVNFDSNNKKIQSAYEYVLTERSVNKMIEDFECILHSS
jgi:glycosyltransferase involved in cell wall biosynthesis